MQPRLLLVLAMWALLGWVGSVPGANAQLFEETPLEETGVCTDSPYTMDSTKTSDDLNGVLASWSNNGCTGYIIFTATETTYYLNDTTTIVDGSDWTLDAR